MVYALNGGSTNALFCDRQNFNENLQLEQKSLRHVGEITLRFFWYQNEVWGEWNIGHVIPVDERGINLP